MSQVYRIAPNRRSKGSTRLRGLVFGHVEDGLSDRTLLAYKLLDRAAQVDHLQCWLRTQSDDQQLVRLDNLLQVGAWSVQRVVHFGRFAEAAPSPIPTGPD